MSENRIPDRLTDSAHVRIAVIVKLLDSARGMGQYDGCAMAYRDVISHLKQALASAEDELTRSPSSELVMGEIMALRRLAAHFEPAPTFYEKKSERCTELMTSFVEEMVDAVNELQATNDAQQTQ
jgi:hypothetical protein